MGRIAKIISFFGKDKEVKIAPGGEEIITAKQFSSPGDDSPPLPFDFCITVFTQEAGGEVSVGFTDTINPSIAAVGEKRIYARNISGAVIVDLWLKSDGSIKAENQSGSFEMQTNGTFVVNGVTIDANGNVTIPNSLVLGGKEINNHVHPAGNPPGDTGPNK